MSVRPHGGLRGAKVKWQVVADIQAGIRERRAQSRLAGKLSAIRQAASLRYTGARCCLKKAMVRSQASLALASS